MPQRKDEYYAGLKENLKWCPICGKRLIRADLGMCQDCSYERSRLRAKKVDAPERKRCPNEYCRQLSVTWNPKSERYECLHSECKRSWTEEEFRIAEQNAPPLQKCSRCKKETMTWVKPFKLYQCVERDCKYVITETEFKKIAGESNQ